MDSKRVLEDLAKLPGIKNTALFVFDFDLTITSQHLHNLITQNLHQVGKDSNRQWELVKNIPPIGDPARWQKIFNKILQQGNLIAIASFNAYPHIIERYLIETVGIKANTVKELLLIKAELPEDPEKTHKNAYIDDLIISYNFNGYRLTPKDVIFIDDSTFNLRAAQTVGCLVIPADAKGTHLGMLEKGLGITEQAFFDKKTGENQTKLASDQDNLPKPTLKRNAS